ncbi:hypothetical protein BpHYR1_012117 [Brachionus plicatilis]|uniref:Uncharacterized protein n=1 Tax=Brachionus plicatilis TaxID=10195 RepID=A0A3M7SK91_BRAPC|nr:hypothetical protein BpHYR1_012117 [Brachionus plicatilis]
MDLKKDLHKKDFKKGGPKKRPSQKKTFKMALSNKKTLKKSFPKKDFKKGFFKKGPNKDLSQKWTLKKDFPNKLL